jgi:hypothetical protein
MKCKVPTPGLAASTVSGVQEQSQVHASPGLYPGQDAATALPTDMPLPGTPGKRIGDYACELKWGRPVFCASAKPAIGVTQDRRETTSFLGTPDTGAWARLAGSSWAPARLDRSGSLTPVDRSMGNRWLLPYRSARHMPIPEYNEAWPELPRRRMSSMRLPMCTVAKSWTH